MFAAAEAAAEASSAAVDADVTSVDAATRHWLATVTSGTPDAPAATSALYAPDAKLWGTVSDELRYTGKDILAYFDYFARVPGLALVPGSYKTSITIDGDTAVASGYYAFVLPDADGKPANVPARFTFVFRRRRRASILPELEAEKRAAVAAQDYEKADAIKAQMAAALRAPTLPGWDIVAHHSSKVPAQPKYLKAVPQPAPPRQPTPYAPAAHGYPTSGAALSHGLVLEPLACCAEDAARLAYEAHKHGVAAARAAHADARFARVAPVPEPPPAVHPAPVAPAAAAPAHPAAASGDAASLMAMEKTKRAAVAAQDYEQAALIQRQIAAAHASSPPPPAGDYWAEKRQAEQRSALAPAQAVSASSAPPPGVDLFAGVGRFLRDLRKLAVIALVGVTLVSPQPGLPRFGGAHSKAAADNKKGDDGSGGSSSVITAVASVMVGIAGIGCLV